MTGSRPDVDVDVVIVGAGLSGVGAAAQLTREHPGSHYLVLEARAESGGTWDLFRYPGVRSDSDMFTLGYRFKPWRGEKALADGPSILAYVRETAREYDVDRHVRYGHRVVAAAWDGDRAAWTVTVATAAGEHTLTAAFVWICAGYYDYDEGYLPVFPGTADFSGTVVHPQAWPADLETRGRRVVVVGSGATAVTLVPALADGGAAHVTMLQRSPTYVVSIPARDPVARVLRRVLPERASYAATRWKNILIATGIYQLSRRRPSAVRRWIRRTNRPALPAAYDVDTHFNPRYDPWDQRLCLVPDGDLFRVVSEGSASMVTDTIDTFTPTGIRLASGAELEADVIVAATGLRVLPMGGIDLTVDGVPVKLPERLTYRALMLSGVPNLVFTVGYTNASWTLKADLVGEYFCRLLSHLDARGLRSFVTEPDPSVREAPLIDFTSGYVLRALDQLPKQGDREPWRLRQNYLRDVRTIRHAPLDDGVLRFSA